MKLPNFGRKTQSAPAAVSAETESAPAVVYMDAAEDSEISADGVLRECFVDAEKIDSGARGLRIPDGVTAIADGAFETYNSDSDIMKSVLSLLFFPKMHSLEVEKELLQCKPKYLPPEVRRLKTLRERRDYLIHQDEDSRLRYLSLPSSVTELCTGSFPQMLSGIYVDEDNPKYRSIDGVLFSKDAKELVRYPGLMADRNYAIPEGTEKIAAGAFYGAFIDELTIPGSLREIPAGIFNDGRYGVLSVGEGVSALREGCFKGCEIHKIVLPSTLAEIGDRAFCEMKGVEDLICRSEGVRLGKFLFEKGKFDDVKWWCWGEVTTGAFMNCELKRITVPEGVAAIGRSAFAGCYKAKEITLPSTVAAIEPDAFDEGPTFSANVNLPEGLYRFLFRFPVCSTINKKPRLAVIRKNLPERFAEDVEVLKKQKRDLETAITKYNLLQQKQKSDERAQIAVIEKLMALHGDEI